MQRLLFPSIAIALALLLIPSVIQATTMGGSGVAYHNGEQVASYPYNYTSDTQEISGGDTYSAEDGSYGGKISTTLGWQDNTFRFGTNAGFIDSGDNSNELYSVGMIHNKIKNNEDQVKSYDLDITIEGAELANRYNEGGSSDSQFWVAAYQVFDSSSVDWGASLSENPLRAYSPNWFSRYTLSDSGLQQEGSELSKQEFSTTSDSTYLKQTSDSLPDDFAGYTFPGKEVNVDLGSLKPGESFDLFYGMRTFAKGSGTNQGAYAYFMDPPSVNISAGGSSSIDSKAVPEPASMMLLGTGLLVLGAVARRKFA